MGRIVTGLVLCAIVFPGSLFSTVFSLGKPPRMTPCSTSGEAARILRPLFPAGFGREKCTNTHNLGKIHA